MLMIERAEMTAADVEETLVPGSRVRGLEREVEELRRPFAPVHRPAHPAEAAHPGSV
jgi:hypothetical protein